jgi:O-antigen ligase
MAASYGCGSRRLLWSNVLDLIALRPWLGWGWGELDYAHYVTLFPGGRFCTLVDNAHNLPLQLAVELGLPAALLLCGGAALIAWRARPWAEAQAPRQLAWGVLLPIGLHSLLEFPLWYGPFQLAALGALALLAGGFCDPYFKQKWPLAHYAQALAAIVLIVCIALLGVQYSALSQLYLPVASRSQALTVQADGRLAQAPLWPDAARFARLTTMKVNAGNAAEAHALALDLLHYSPEPRVIERLIDSAELLGRTSEAQFHRDRYAAAYPADYAKWLRGAKAPAAAK